MNIFVSAFHKIEVDVEEFFQHPLTSAAKFCKAFLFFLKKAPNALQTASNFLAELSPVVVAAVGLADPLVEPEVAAALSVVETAIGALGASLQAASSGGSFLDNLVNFNKTIPATLSALDVKNPQLKSKVEWIANFITSECKVLIPAAESWVKKLASSGQSTTASTATTAAA